MKYKAGRQFMQNLKSLQEDIGILSETPWSLEGTKNLTGTQLADILSTLSEQFRLVDYDWKKTLVDCYGENEDGSLYSFDDSSLSLTHYSHDSDQAWVNFLEDLRLWDGPLPSTMKHGWYEATTEEVDELDFLASWCYSVRITLPTDGHTTRHRREGLDPPLTESMSMRPGSPANVLTPPFGGFRARFYDRRDLELKIRHSWRDDGITVTVKYHRFDDDEFDQYTRVTLRFSFIRNPIGTLNYPPHMLTEYEEVQRKWFS